MSDYYSFERRNDDVLCFTTEDDVLCFTTEDETKVFVHPGDVMWIEPKGSGEYVCLVFPNEERLLVDGCGGIVPGAIEAERQAWKPSADRE